MKGLFYTLPWTTEWLELNNITDTQKSDFNRAQKQFVLKMRNSLNLLPFQRPARTIAQF
jgi:hypothetical protein